MCKASIVAERVERAKHGQHLEIGVSSYGLAAFHQKGTEVTDCVTCVKDGEKLTIWGISRELQEKYSIGAMENVVFVDSGDNKQDFLAFENGKQVPLFEFAGERVNVYVGELERPEATLDDGAGLGDRAATSDRVTA